MDLEVEPEVDGSRPNEALSSDCSEALARANMLFQLMEWVLDPLCWLARALILCLEVGHRGYQFCLVG